LSAKDPPWCQGQAEVNHPSYILGRLLLKPLVLRSRILS